MAQIDFDNVSFSVEREELVMRAVSRASGKTYRHTCPQGDFETVAHEIAEAGEEGVDRAALRGRTQLPWTRINVAVLFMFERGSIRRRGPRECRFVSVARSLYLNAMIEYYALADEEPTAPRSADGGQPPVP